MSLQQPIGLEGDSASSIAASVETVLGKGGLAPGDALPSVRILAGRLGVSPATVAAAYADLRRRGLVVTRPRSGVRVADRPPVAAPTAAGPPAGARDLSRGNPDPRLLPGLRDVLRGPDLGPRLYGEAAVVPELDAVARAALAADGLDVARLCVVSGALDGVERVLGAQLARGDRVAVEDPGYASALDLLRALGLTPVPVAVDAQGMRPEALRAALAAGVRAVLVTPRGQNPTGAAVDVARAAALGRELDREPEVLVVEDDHLGAVAGAPLRTLTGGRRRWAAIRSVSKWLGPDLRLAVLAGDATTVGRVEGRLALGAGWVSSLLQRAVADLWSGEDAAGLAEQAVTVYAGRRRALVTALAGHGIAATGESGLNVWVPVPDEDAAVRRLLSAGWAVAAGARSRLRSGPAIRVTTATLRPAEAERLAADLARVLRPAGLTRTA